MLPDKELLSKTISFLRFPLIVGVVFIHTNLTDVSIDKNILVTEAFFFHDILRYLISENFARIAVPLFFFISGFLFFYKTEFSTIEYFKKLKKRFNTLLIPYLFWNIFVLFLFFLTQTFLSSMTSGENKLIVNYTLYDWLDIFWSPICYQFWFIRDLMVVVLCSPLIYLLIYKLKVYVVIMLGILWCLDIWFSVTGFSSIAFFFFSFGAWFAINRRNFVVDFKPLRLSFTFFYLIIVIANIILFKHNSVNVYIHNIGIIAGLITVLTWTALGIQKKCLKFYPLLATCSFFIYAYYGMPIALFVKLWTMIIRPATELTMLLGYFVIPFTVVGLGIGIYMVMKKWFPSFTSIIIGSR